jgi:recombination protein RecA
MVRKKKTPPKKEESKQAPVKEEKQEQVEAIDDIPKLKTPTAEDQKEFKKTLTAMEKEFGEGVIASAEDILNVDKVPTRNLLLDILTEGGLPKGSISLFFGEESSGKSAQAYALASIFTLQGIPVLDIACEGDIDKTWIQKMGNDLKHFYVARPDDLEKAIDIADVAVRSRKYGLVIFDSVTAGIPREASDKKTEKDQMALQARRNGKLVQKLTSGLQPANLKNPDDYNNTMVILIAHLREKVGVVYGNPETIPGGHALKHHSAYIVKYKRGAKLTKKEDIVGREVRITIDKAKFSVPLVKGVTEFFFSPPRYNNAKVLLTYATQYGIIERNGAYYSYGDIKVQGQKDLLLTLKEKGLLPEIKEKLIRRFGDE